MSHSFSGRLGDALPHLSAHVELELSSVTQTVAAE